MREEAEDSTPEGRSHLDDKLHLIIGGVTGCDKGGVQSAAERGQGVHGLLVVESEDGVHPAGELRANCRDSKVHEGHELKKNMIILRKNTLFWILDPSIISNRGFI